MSDLLNQIKGTEVPTAAQPVAKRQTQVEPPLPPPEQIGGTVAPNGASLTNVVKAYAPHGRMSFEKGTDLDEARRVHDRLQMYVDLYRAGFPGKARHMTDTQIAKRHPDWRLWKGTPGNIGIAKAVDTGSTPGQEWVGVGYSNRLAESVWAGNPMGEAVRRIDWVGTNNSFVLNVPGTRVVAVVGSENTSDTASLVNAVDPDTDSATFTASKLEGRTAISREWVEDANVDLSALEMGHIDAHRTGFDEAIINGDSDGTHFDDDTQAGAATLAAKLLNGLTKDAIGTSATYNAGAVPMSTDVLIGMLKKLGAGYSESEAQLVLLLSTASRFDLSGSQNIIANASGFDSSLNSIDRALAGMFGFRSVVTSHRVRQDVEADGLADNPTVSTLTRPLIFNYMAYAYSVKREPEILVEKVPGSDTLYMVSSQRFAFGKTVSGGTIGAGDAACAMGINITTA
jgi:hypothetical protein